MTNDTIEPCSTTDDTVELCPTVDPSKTLRINLDLPPEFQFNGNDGEWMRISGDGMAHFPGGHSLPLATLIAGLRGFATGLESFVAACKATKDKKPTP